jgi:hypothetical protein
LDEVNSLAPLLFLRTKLVVLTTTFHCKENPALFLCIEPAVIWLLLAVLHWHSTLASLLILAADFYFACTVSATPSQPLSSLHLHAAAAIRGISCPYFAANGRLVSRQPCVACDAAQGRRVGGGVCNVSLQRVWVGTGRVNYASPPSNTQFGEGDASGKRRKCQALLLSGGSRHCAAHSAQSREEWCYKALDPDMQQCAHQDRAA